MTEQMLRQYTVLVEYLGATLGPDYEVVLHEILPETSRVAAIANGTISGRSVGAPITNAALRMIMQKQYETSDYNLNYTGQLANGKTIRSSTMFIKDSGKLVGLLCINFDDSRFHEISDAILKLIHPDDFVHHHYFPVDAPAKQPMQPQHAAAVPAEHFQSDMNSLMEELFETVTKSVNVPLDRLTQAERTRIIAQLHEQGMFELRGAVQFTVKKLSCSQASIYRYIKKQRRERTRRTSDPHLSGRSCRDRCPHTLRQAHFSLDHRTNPRPDGLLCVRARVFHLSSHSLSWLASSYRRS